MLAKADEYRRYERPNSGPGAAAVAAAVSQVGAPYRWGSASPEIGFDCSGLVWWAYRQAGIELPRTTLGQIDTGEPVSTDQLHIGDLVFSRGGSPQRDLGHVAIYIGNGQVVFAPATGQRVSIRPLPSRVQAVRRIV